MTWMDYHKAYNSVPHSWILTVLSIYRMADNIRGFLQTSMTTWRVALTLNGQILGHVCIRRSIFQNDALSPLLFVMCLFSLTTLPCQFNKGIVIDGDTISCLLYLDDLKLYAKSREGMVSLINNVRIFSTNIKMDFGFEKCATLSVKRGDVVNCEGSELPTGIIRTLPIDSAYKYLTVLEAGGFKCAEVKSRVQEMYKQRLQQLILKSQLNGWNQIQAINRFAVPVIRYTTGIIDWTLHKCAELDRFTRKQMTLFKAMHPCADIDRLYVACKKGGKGLFSVADIMCLKKYFFSVYVTESKE